LRWDPVVTQNNFCIDCCLALVLKLQQPKFWILNFHKFHLSRSKKCFDSFHKKLQKHLKAIEKGKRDIYFEEGK
jgi:hypothetical protein